MSLAATFTVTFLWLLLAIHLLIDSQRSRTASLLMALNCLLWANQNALLLVHYIENGIWISITRATMAMLLGPALYGLYLNLTKTPIELKPVQLLHVFPVLVVAVLATRNIQFFGVFIEVFIILSMFCYATYIALFMYFSGGATLKHEENSDKSAYLWLYFLSVSMLISLLGDIAIAIEVMNGRPLFESRALLLSRLLALFISGFTLLCFLGRSPLLDWIYKLGESHRQKYLKSKLTPELCEHYFAILDKYLREKKPHLEGSIKVIELSQTLDIPARQLSETVNQTLGKSVSKFLNELRIAEAKTLLCNKPELSVTDIVYECGFSSKSSFNDEFLKLEGVSPSVFRKKAIFTQS